MTNYDEALVARAFELADRLMFERVIEDGWRDPKKPDRVLFHGARGWTGKYASQSKRFKEAFKWLKDRGYVELIKEEAGEYISILREPQGETK